MIRFLLTLLVLMGGLAAEGGVAQAQLIGPSRVAQRAGGQQAVLRLAGVDRITVRRDQSWLALAVRPEGRLSPTLAPWPLAEQAAAGTPTVLTGIDRARE